MVKERRGTRLSPDETIFSGLFWTGGRGMDLGLVDGLGDMRSEIRKRFGDKAKLELVSAPKSLFGRKMPGVGTDLEGAPERLAMAGVGAIAALAEEKSLWSRYGL